VGVEFVSHFRGSKRKLCFVYWRRRRWFEKVCNSLAATVLHPVLITHGQDRDDGNGKEDTGDARKFFPCENREDHGEWVKMYALSD
jgi:hypothetical protein